MAVPGRALWSALFDDATSARLVRLLDDSVLDATVELGEGLAGLPVELLRLPDGRLLATVPGVRLSRRLAGVERAATPPLAGPLKILAAVAAPTETRTANAPLDVEAEMQSLLDAVTDLEGGAGAQVRILKVASQDEIGRPLAADQDHVLHLSAHGSPTVSS
ncbi:CHAT domain-containing protein [Actinokineospora soli]|uniref:CHAT domain-containing protein n=1 Tax=Actinokineospora soli TaxID=1048753 RepID=A0ABW2TLJ9_9PSEU